MTITALAATDLPVLMTIEQTAQLLGISRSAAYRAAAAGQIPPSVSAAGCLSPPHGCSRCSASSRPPTLRPSRPTTEHEPRTGRRVGRGLAVHRLKLQPSRDGRSPVIVVRPTTGATAS